MLDTVTVDTFAPHVGEKFLLQISDDERIEVTLVAADNASKKFASGPHRAPFSLLFRPPHGRILQQGIHHMVHERLGALDIFLVPVTPDAEGPLLEAIFS